MTIFPRQPGLNELDPPKRFRIDVTDGDSSHGWTKVLETDDGVFAGQEAARLWYTRKVGDVCGGGVRVVEQIVRVTLPR